MRRAWPRILALGLGVIPVIVLIAMVASIGANSRDAVFDQSQAQPTPPNLAPTEVPEANATPIAVAKPRENENPFDNIGRLFGTDFSTIYSDGVGRYGLRPAIFGTLLVVFVAMSLALPVSLAMGVFSAEFPLGPLGRAMRVTLGVLSGIPPIVYALMAVLFVGPFISNKFTANWTYATADPAAIGADPETWPAPGVPWNPGAFPWDPSGQFNSVLLAGIMLALLVIPFMAPLIEDSLRSVPRDPKDASLALGATRWYTLRRITMKRAMPGLIAATGLGTLKVMGDVMIVLIVVGFDARMPSPLFDVLERTAPLPSTGAALLGGVASPDACRGADCGVGYFSALLLLVLALLVVLTTGFLERRVRRRLAI